MQVRVNGTPIGGEDPREHAWRAGIAAAAKGVGIRNVNSVSLAFTIDRGRRVDIDNLARPVLAGLRDAGWFTRGYKMLDRLVVTKTHGENVGVEILPSAPRPDLNADVDVEIFSKTIVPSHGNHDIKRMRRDTVRNAWQKPAMDGPVEVQLGFRTKLSLVDLLKPNIDTLEPILGRDPRGRMEFCPLDDKITRLSAWRCSGDLAMVVRVIAARTARALPPG